MKNFIISLIVFIILMTIGTSTTYATQKASGSSATLALEQPAQVADKRVYILRAFLESYNSPLAASADTFVLAADEHNLDWKFVAAIAGVESTFGHHIPYNSYNAWGWGVYGDNVIRFQSFDEGIQTISQALRERYMDRWGATTTYEIGRYYAASPTWAQKVEFFMRQIDRFAMSKATYNLPLSI